MRAAYSIGMKARVSRRTNL